MKDIQRLVRLIDKFSPTTSPLLNLQDESTLEAKLFNLLKEGEVRSDEAVAEALYGEGKLTSSYRMLKSRFRRKLLNHLHFQNLPDKVFSRRAIATQHCLSLQQEAHFLILMSEYRLADKLLEQIMETAARYELTDQTINALEMKQHISTNLGDEQRYQKQDAMLLKARRTRQAEVGAQRTYQLLMVQQKSNVQLRGRIIEQYPETLQQLHDSWLQTGAACVYYYFHLLRVHYLELIGDYKTIAEAVEETEELFQKGKISETWYSRKFNIFSKIYALLQAREYEKGLATADECKTEFILFSINWFAFMENYILLAIHSKRHTLAVELLEQLFVNKHYTKIPSVARERLEVIRRYVVLLLRNELSDKELHRGEVFIDHLTILPKDKSGFNLALLVLDVLEKLSEGELDDLEVQAERVRKYAQKYLKGEKAERPRLFMRLLLLALTRQNAREAREQGQQLLEKLRAEPLPGDAFTEVEIVPYEHLWEHALLLLERQQGQL